MINQTKAVVARDPQRQGPNDNNGDRGDSQGDGNNQDPSVISVVFVTASPTFTGKTAGFTTMSRPPQVLDVPSRQVAQQEVTESPAPEPSAQQELPTKEEQASFFSPVALTTDQSEEPSQQPSQPEEPSQQPSQPDLLPETVVQEDRATPSASSDDVVAFPLAAASSVLSTSVPLVSTTGLLLASSADQPTATSGYQPIPTSLDNAAQGPEAAAEGTADSSTENTASSTSSGMSAGGKAGLAIGIIAIICLLAGAAFWLYRKKEKKPEGYGNPDDEKSTGLPALVNKRMSRRSMGGGSTEKSNVPRLSLRPVTQFLPDFAGAKKGASPDNRLSTANTPTGMVANGANRSLTHGNTSNPFKDPVNPFGDEAKSVSLPNVTVTPPPSSDSSNMEAVTDNSIHSPAGSAGTAGAAAAVAGAAAAIGAVKPGVCAPRNEQGRSEGSRVGSAAAGAAGAAGAGPVSNRAPPILYRVHLAFKPSMEDELELHAGQLIKILHEYDDGWALCVRPENRSKQGVAPRTCLSVQPAKLRTGNGPPVRISPNGQQKTLNQSRPTTPSSNAPSTPPAHSSPVHGPSRPGTSHSNRSVRSPAQQQQQQQQQLSPTRHQNNNSNVTASTPGQFNQAPRPLSPGPVARPPNPQSPKRSQSPGPYGAKRGPTPMTSTHRRRSNSASAVQAKRNSPRCSSPLARESVVGWTPPKPDNNAAGTPSPA